MANSYVHQLLGGVRLGGIAVGGFALLFVTLDGLARLFSKPLSGLVSADRFVGCVEVFAVSVILWLTANVWAKWIVAMVSVVALKSLIGLIGGTTVALPLRSVPRLIAGETLAYFLVAAFISVRFISHTPRAIEKTALVVFVLATCVDMLFEPAPLALAVGGAALVASRIIATYVYGAGGGKSA